MPRRNERTEYSNGCTDYGYGCSAAFVGTLVVGLPVLHLLYFNDAPPRLLEPCMREANVTAAAHDAALSLYFRYEVDVAQRCTLETRILRGCVANDTRVVQFVRYPPGPLRAKQARDVVEKFQFIERDYLDVQGVPFNGPTADGNASERAACAKPGPNFARLLPRLTSPPYSTSLRSIPPFSALLSDSNSSKLVPLLRYVDYACLAAAEHALSMLDAATEANGRGRVDLSGRLAEFFVATARTPGLCTFPSLDANAGWDCPMEKDTYEGEEKGSDLGLGKCDFVEFTNVA